MNTQDPPPDPKFTFTFFCQGKAELQVSHDIELIHDVHKAQPSKVWAKLNEDTLLQQHELTFTFFWRRSHLILCSNSWATCLPQVTVMRITHGTTRLKLKHLFSQSISIISVSIAQLGNTEKPFKLYAMPNYSEGQICWYRFIQLSMVRT